VYNRDRSSWVEIFIVIHMSVGGLLRGKRTADKHREPSVTK
jgi:hypothetical protein